MNLQKSILLITNQNADVSKQIEEICFNNFYTLYKLYSMVDAIPVIKETNFNLMIIDTKHIQVDSNLFGLFQHKDFFIPHIIIISDEEVNISNNNASIIKRNEINKLEDILSSHQNQNYSNFPTRQTPFIRNTVEKQLSILGFSRRYKGFDYMTEIVIKILYNATSKNSFKKYIYPYVSSLYNVSEESVERDIRNLISKLQPNDYFNFKPTTKNIVNAVVSYIKDYLNKLSNYKLYF